MKRLKRLSQIVILSLGLTVISRVETAQAKEVCRLLQAVGGGTEVTKTVSPGGTLFTGDNWNTDFVVPTDRFYDRFEVRVMPQNDANYSMNFYLKYPNNTADKFFSREAIPLRRNQLVIARAKPRALTLQPFQVNVFVGGTEAIGTVYTATVLACFNN